MLLTSGQGNGHTKGQIHEFVFVAKNFPIDAFKNNLQRKFQSEELYDFTD